MNLRHEAIEGRLKELDEILAELRKYQEITTEEMQESLSQRWVVERGLIAASTVLLDIADHILAGHFGVYAETYEESLTSLEAKGVISEEVYGRIKGLGGFRNILVHRYLDIDPREVQQHLEKGLDVFPRFAQEILDWLEAQES